MANLKVFLVPVIPLIIFLLVLLFGYLFSDKKKVEALNRLARVFHGRVNRPFVPSLSDADYQGLKFSIVLHPRSSNSPEYLKITLFKDTYYKLSVSKESFLSDICERLGIVNQVRVDDEVFDKEFMLFTDKPQQFGGHFDNEDMKDAIRVVFGEGFNEILIDGKSVFTKKTGYILGKDLEPQYIRNILRNLNVIARWADA